MECSFNDDALPWRLTHMPSGAYLLIGGRHGEHELTGVVGDGPLREWTLYTWPSVLEKVKGWAREVKRDVDTPDLWGEVRRRQGVLTGTIYEESDNTPFTKAELVEIADKVQQIKEFVKTQPISEARMLSAEAKLDYVLEASRRLGRKDWAIIFGGAIVSTIVADLLPREVAGDLLTMAAQVLGHIFVSILSRVSLRVSLDFSGWTDLPSLLASPAQSARHPPSKRFRPTSETATTSPGLDASLPTCRHSRP